MADLDAAIAECGTTQYQSIIIDSIDWTERLLIDALLAESKKKSIEDWGYGKGWVQVAERMSRLLNSLDQLIAKGKNVVLIAHSKVQRVEPPDLLAAYDRYELKLSKQCSPLVKEWADELWFFRFKTKAIQSESGRAKGIGGKERIILTTHSAAYDAKTRSGLAEELPMVWESVSHLFSAQPAAAASSPDVPAWQFRLEEKAEQVNAFLRGKSVISADQTWRDAPQKALDRIAADPGAFLSKVAEWGAA